MNIIDLFKKIEGIHHCIDHLDDQKQLLLGLSQSAKALCLSSLSTEKDQLYIIVYNEYQAEQLATELRTLVDKPIYLFTTNDILLAELSTTDPIVIAKKVRALSALANNEECIVIITAGAAMQRLPYVASFKKARLSLEVGMTFEYEELRTNLVNMGYKRSDQVETQGEFSIRGSIIDIYPLNDDPIRLDFFDDEIESIRYFDSATQRSKTSIQHVNIYPATDLIISQSRYKEASQRLQEELMKADSILSKEQKDYGERYLNHWSQGQSDPMDRYFISYFYPKITTIFDYFSDNGLLIIDDLSKLYEEARHLEAELSDILKTKQQEGQIFKEVSILTSLNQHIKEAPQNKIYLSLLHKGLGRLSFDAKTQIHCQSMQQFYGQLASLKAELTTYRRQKSTVIITAETKEGLEKLQQVFADIDESVIVTKANELLPHEVQLTLLPLTKGFILPENHFVVMTEKDILETVKTKRKPSSKTMSNAERIKSYNELNVGDYVVHVNHGIGRYMGMETIEMDGIHQDYMTIVYQNDDQLFIPVTQLDLIQKYIGSGDGTPKLDALNSKKWHKTRQKVEKRVEDMADELIQLYAEREAQKGFAFSKDNEEQEAFEAAFPYAETDDQLRSIEEIKKDMENERPMDRLLVGDVGYGKTEVALRSAFKAVQDHKQVVILVPTTVLAQQHYETMLKRMAGFPVRIALLNRFKTPKEQKEILDQLKDGTIDIIVGTHRILSQDVQFCNLGLMIIDEEQRFGVRHKERLKQLKTSVDALTLTATPIPRTLHMSMLGVRDLSVIETPPQNRYPVQTYVMEQNISAISDGIQRELERSGQVFYLYNRVDTIEKKVSELKQLVPDAKIAYAHGQMNENELEDVLMRFLNHEFDVLVTTTIIETGIDMPNVNTIFVENADKMGLSQLYQLRGRVGRSNRIAYAYFMYEPMKSLSEVSEKRLEALREFTELGAGFKIAMRDLSIRGAGDLLGSQQHGFIDSVGFDLYSQLLQEAVMRKQGKEKEHKEDIVMHLNIDAYIPDFYITSSRLKVELYKRLKEVETEAELEEIEDDMMDRFGEFPDEVSYLIESIRLKLLASSVGVTSIECKNDIIRVTMTEEASQYYKPNDYMTALNKVKLKVRFDVRDVMILNFTMGKQRQTWLFELQTFFSQLGVITHET